jgi:hypothetical protein
VVHHRLSKCTCHKAAAGACMSSSRTSVVG